MGLEQYSDYGSGSSMNSSTSWGSQELDWQTFQSQLLNAERTRTKAASFADLVSGRCTIEDVMQEFRRNGSDAPYSPEDEGFWRHASASAYRRQVSWPAADRPRGRPLSSCYPPSPSAALCAGPVASAGPGSMGHMLAASEPIPIPNTGMNEAYDAPSGAPPAPLPCALTDEQRRVLSSLPDAAVLSLLREMQRRNRRQPEECRFCKNNGERESYYRAHVLKDAAGRVQCPVLRAFVCKRCGASGDTAHTIKYCALSTSEERIKSAAMMRSMRMASGRRRALAPSSGGGENYVVLGEALRDGRGRALVGHQGALDPQWTALEQKLIMLS